MVGAEEKTQTQKDRRERLSNHTCDDADRNDSVEILAGTMEVRVPVDLWQIGTQCASRDCVGFAGRNAGRRVLLYLIAYSSAPRQRLDPAQDFLALG